MLSSSLKGEIVIKLFGVPRSVTYCTPYYSREHLVPLVQRLAQPISWRKAQSRLIQSHASERVEGAA
jgi:hypothetical protein